MGNSGDINCWSGTPYFLFQAAQRTGLLTNTLDLRDPNYRRRRGIWNLLAPLRLERPGGYQYSRDAQERMWECVPEALRHGEIISHLQLFPPLRRARAAGAQHSFYIDATLAQLFSEGFLTNTIGRRTWADAIRRERELYHAAKFVVAMSRNAAAIAISQYALDAKKVFVVRPGANINEDDVTSYLNQRGQSWRQRTSAFTRERPARLGFIGRDFERKGLPRLVAAAEILHQRGRAVKVSIIGNYPPSLQRHPLVELVGFVHKEKQAAMFLEAVDQFALGCLPSYAEPLGISTLECLRLGVPVFGTDVGGIPDCVPPGAGFLVERNATPEQIADAIDFHVFDPARYLTMVEDAERNMSLVTWEDTARHLTQIWDGDAAVAEQQYFPASR